MASSSSSAAPAVLKLHQYGARWELPSFDPFCLSAQAYMRLAGVTFEELGDDYVAGTNAIFTYVGNKTGKSLDSALNAEQKATAAAFIHLIETKLHPTLLYNWWAEKQNMGQTLVLPHFNSMVFPLGYVLPRLKQRNVQSYLYTLNLTQDEKVYNDAEECYAALADFLGDKHFFFGDSLDAVAFGHLAIHLVAPQSHKLRSRLLQHKNLEAFCKRVMTLYFGQDFPAIPAPPPATEDKDQKQEMSQHKKTGMYLLTGAGLLILLHYLTKQHQAAHQ
ncbi:metaxin 1, putative [Acanthamoeba castellanii str. Neff]|uniref:Metaxin 1, putative n=1 Tax=Acanthamoeba castellanii (strain ATCC 30010 / Neff) TaxID=1257118 RepID=L8GSF9_ACACF|nr:metaxin 1, putative [Acanthamoeba castellanii str. Neff]ELR15887.1 metaxin 1, putative [Acanthamoeba castellanii str. Neff]